MPERPDPKTLYGILAKEAEDDSLQYIEPTLYRDIAEMLGSLKGQGYSGLEAKARDSLACLIGDTARALLGLRVAKLRNAQTTNHATLTDEERYIAQAEKELRSRFEEVLSATLNGRTKALESIANKARTAPVLVRFVRQSQSVNGVDDKRYGPFEQEDVAVLPFENARTLIEQGTAIELPWLDQ